MLTHSRTPTPMPPSVFKTYTLNQRTSNTYHILSSPSTSSNTFSCHPPLLLHLRLDFLVQFPTFSPQLCILLHPNSRTNHLRDLSKSPLFLRAGWDFLAYCLFEQFNVCFVTAGEVSALRFLDGESTGGKTMRKATYQASKRAICKAMYFFAYAAAALKFSSR
jgi:hypothetical protein